MAEEPKPPQPRVGDPASRYPEWGHLKGPHCSSPPHVSRGKGVSDEANDTTFQGMD